MDRLDAGVSVPETATVGRLKVGVKMSKLDSALFLAGVRLDAHQKALDFLRECNGDVVRIRAEIEYRYELVNSSDEPRYQSGESPTLFLETYIEELKRIVADLAPAMVLAA